MFQNKIEQKSFKISIEYTQLQGNFKGNTQRPKIGHQPTSVIIW